MRHFLTAVMLFAGIVVATGAASAQFRGPYGDPYPPSRERGGYDSGAVNRVIGHIDRAEWGRYLSHGDRKHLESARRDLFRFQDDWMRGRFDRGRLDNAIGHLNHVANSYQLPPRERDMLMRDVYELRDFRERGSGYRW